MRPALPILLPFVLALLAAASCRKPPDTLIKHRYNEEAMEAAIATAREKIDEFLSAFEAGDAEDYSVKAPVTDGENTEHFWLSDIAYADGFFEGTIANEPGMVDNVTFGQRWRIAKEEISDWMYMKGGRMHGNFTLRVLLDTMPEEEAAAWRARLAE